MRNVNSFAAYPRDLGFGTPGAFFFLLWAHRAGRTRLVPLKAFGIFASGSTWGDESRRTTECGTAVHLALRCSGRIPASLPLPVAVAAAQIATAAGRPGRPVRSLVAPPRGVDDAERSGNVVLLARSISSNFTSLKFLNYSYLTEEWSEPTIESTLNGGPH